jgi:hypothetical protein
LRNLVMQIMHIYARSVRTRGCYLVVRSILGSASLFDFFGGKFFGLQETQVTATAVVACVERGLPKREVGKRGKWSGESEHERWRFRSVSAHIERRNRLITIVHITVVPVKSIGHRLPQDVRRCVGSKRVLGCRCNLRLGPESVA